MLARRVTTALPSSISSAPLVMWHRWFGVWPPACLFDCCCCFAYQPLGLLTACLPPAQPLPRSVMCLLVCLSSASAASCLPALDRHLANSSSSQRTTSTKTKKKNYKNNKKVSNIKSARNEHIKRQQPTSTQTQTHAHTCT